MKNSIPLLTITVFLFIVAIPGWIFHSTNYYYAFGLSWRLAQASPTSEEMLQHLVRYQQQLEKHGLTTGNAYWPLYRPDQDLELHSNRVSIMINQLETATPAELTDIRSRLSSSSNMVQEAAWIKSRVAVVTLLVWTIALRVLSKVLDRPMLRRNPKVVEFERRQQATKTP